MSTLVSRCIRAALYLASLAFVFVIMSILQPLSGNAQPQQPLFSIQPGSDNDHPLVINVPAGSGTFALDLGGADVSLPGKPPVSGDYGMVSFPSGGTIRIPCGAKKVIITGTNPVFRLAKRPSTATTGVQH